MDEITIIAGQSITVGFVASTLAQWVKGKDWFPDSAAAIRIILALFCLGISAGASYFQGDVLTIETAVAAFFTYVTASASWLHLFKTT